MTNMKIGTTVRQCFSIFRAVHKLSIVATAYRPKNILDAWPQRVATQYVKKLLWYRLLPLCLAAQSLGESLTLTFD